VVQPTNESNAAILPDPELNPLLNPLLAAHMGRWAEVYFTSPPEKRAQAVSDLVRELAHNATAGVENNKANDDQGIWENEDEESRTNHIPSQSAGGVYVPPVRSSESTIPDSATSPSIVNESTSRICESCGHRNAPQQSFCGMCGKPMTISTEDSTAGFEETEAIATSTWPQSGPLPPGLSEQDFEIAADSPPADKSYQDEGYQEHSIPSWAPADDRPMEFSVLSDYETEPASHGYRIYVGLAMALLLGALVYMTWRSNTAFWSSSTAPSALPQAVPAAKSEPTAAAEPPAAAPVHSATPTNSAPQTAPAASPEQNQTTAEAHPAGVRRTDHGMASRQTKTRTVPRTPVTANPPASAADQNGSEELAVAEKYLNAGSGTARDSRQASMWLWKAVAKQNSTATLILSDLYLRGDGVTKSCDQARLLLDAAARKGQTAAGQRLRNLQAFGCR
jgi:TPR repeat protein